MKLSENFKKLEASMNLPLLEREDEVHTALLALLTNSHHFQYGEPGVAKSMLVNILCSHISDLNGDSFQYLLTKYTTPDEISGIVDLKAFRDGTFRKITSRKLPEAKIAFLDETFNGSSAILNTILEILNERRFDRGDKIVDVPLISLFGASNSIPRDPELRALADRLHFWHHVKPIQDPSNRAKLLSMGETPEPTDVISLDEIAEAQAEVSEVDVDDTVVDTLLTVYEDLQDEGIHVTDRRFRHALKVIQAEAWLDGRDVSVRRDIRPLQFMFWQDPEKIQLVSSTVLNNISIVASEISEIKSGVAELMNNLDAVQKDSKERLAIVSAGSEAASKLSVAKDECKALRKKKGLDKDDKADIEKLGRYIQSSYEKIQKEVFNIDDTFDSDLFKDDSNDDEE